MTPTSPVTLSREEEWRIRDILAGWLWQFNDIPGDGEATAENRQQADELLEHLRACRLAVVPIEAASRAVTETPEGLDELRERVETLLRVAFHDEDFLTANSIPMAATPGVRRALRNVRATLARLAHKEEHGG